MNLATWLVTEYCKPLTAMVEMALRLARSVTQYPKRPGVLIRKVGFR